VLVLVHLALAIQPVLLQSTSLLEMTQLSLPQALPQQMPHYLKQFLQPRATLLQQLLALHLFD
jgi:hypothetical protein